MTSNKFDKNFISAVSNFVYDLIARDLSEPPEQRHFFPSCVSSLTCILYWLQALRLLANELEDTGPLILLAS